jgi:hypothetical protein
MQNLRKIVTLTMLICLTLASAAAAKTVTLAWDFNTEPDIAGYRIYYSLGSAGPPYNGTGALEGDSPIDVGLVTTTTLSNLPDDVDLYVSATAYNSSGLESLHAPEVFSAGVVTIPDGVTTKAVTLAWDANAEPDVIGYKLYYSVGTAGPPYNGTGAYEGDSPIDVGWNTSVTVSNLPAGQAIYFSSTAYNALGVESDYSSEVVSAPLVADADSDGILDGMDNCPAVFNEFQVDIDLDGVGDACDNCQFDQNPQQLDGDLNGIGDICDLGSDDDADGVADAFDNCVDIYNPGQDDGDGDGIGDACTTIITYPNGGQIMEGNALTTINWTETPIATSYDILYSINDGAGWVVIDNVPAPASSYVWTLPSLNSKYDLCKVRIRALDGGGGLLNTDDSDSVFSINSSVVVSYPNGGQTFTGGALTTISWAEATNAASYDIWYSTNGGAGWVSLTNVASLSTSYIWTIPVLTSGQVVIRVRALNESGVLMNSDDSNSLFIIE